MQGMADELTPEQAASLKAVLQESRRELEELLALTKQEAKPVALSEPIGRLTRMDALQQQAMAKANRANYERKLRLVRAALDAFERGGYGECRECEEPIGFRRLKARPESPYCLACQDARES